MRLREAWWTSKIFVDTDDDNAGSFAGSAMEGVVGVSIALWKQRYLRWWNPCAISSWANQAMRMIIHRRVANTVAVIWCNQGGLNEAREEENEKEEAAGHQVSGLWGVTGLSSWWDSSFAKDSEGSQHQCCEKYEKRYVTFCTLPLS